MFNNVHRLYRKKFLLLMVISTWLCAFGTLVPTWFGKWGRFGLDINVGSCSILADENGYSPKQFLFVVAFGIPCFFITICYARIFYIVRMTACRSHTASSSRNNTVTATITMATAAVATVDGQQNNANETYYSSVKSEHLPQLSIEDSAIGSNVVPLTCTEKSSTLIVNENEIFYNENTNSKEIILRKNAVGICGSEFYNDLGIVPCPNLLSSPNRRLYYAKIMTEPSSSAGIKDEYIEEHPTSRSLPRISVYSSHKFSSPIRVYGKKARKRRPSIVNATFMAMTFRRKSPINFNSRRRSALSLPGKMLSKDKKLLKMILVIFSSFVICYLPITITKTSTYLSQFHVLNICGYLLIYLTTCINPIIYVVMSSEYRQAYKNLLTCRRSSLRTCRT